jgi:hypothetical protein
MAHNSKLVPLNQRLTKQQKLKRAEKKQARFEIRTAPKVVEKS